MSARPKYQIFVSSTFSDLADARREAMFQILRARHIPAGMEWFPATDDRGWKFITQMIDQADYYILIVGGRYGSLDVDTGMSWTEREYRYAVEKGIPVFAFVRDPSQVPSTMTEDSDELRSKLRDFVALVKTKHMVEFWGSEKELGSKILLSVTVNILDDESMGRARVGWFRGDEIAGPDALETIARLRHENEALRTAGVAAEVPRPMLMEYFRSRSATSGVHANLLEEILESAPDLVSGAIPREIGKHLVLHSLASIDELGGIFVSDLGRAFLSRAVLEHTGARGG